MSTVKPLLLASIHDVSPVFESDVDSLLDLMHPHVGTRLAMLVIPNRWGESPIIPGSPFATRLRAWAENGIEIFLHGFFHRDDAGHRGLDAIRANFLTAREGEFLGIARTEAVSRITAGRELVEQITGREIAGFVAPAWLYGPQAALALSDCGVRLAEDHWRVWSPRSGQTLARGPVITWASRSPARLNSSLAAAAVLRRFYTAPVLRVAAHPPDCRSPRLVASISATLASAARKRTPAGYSDLLGRA